MRARTGWQLAALCTVPFIMVLGNSMLIPVLPAMRTALHLSPAQSGLVITAFSIPAGLAIFLAGYWADHFGRKAVLVPALLVYGLGGLICYVGAAFLGSGAFGVILFGRIVQGIGAAGTAPVAMAMVGDLFQSAERAKGLGLLESSNGMGKVLSPILGAALGVLGWRYVFAGYAALSVPAAAAVWWMAREPKAQRAQAGTRAYLAGVWQTFRAKALPLSAAFLAGTSVLFVLFGVLFYLSETLEQKYGLDGIPKGLALAVPLLAMSATSYLTGASLGRHLRWLKPAVVTGLTTGAAGMALVPLLGGTRLRGLTADLVFFGGMVLLGIGSGLVLPALNTLVTSAVGEKQRGMITSAYGMVRFFGVALGPLVFGWLMGVGKSAPFWLAAALLGLAAVAGLLLINPTQLMGKRAGGGWQPEGTGPRERERPAAKPAAQPRPVTSPAKSPAVSPPTLPGAQPPAAPPPWQPPGDLPRSPGPPPG